MWKGRKCSQIVSMYLLIMLFISHFTNCTQFKGVILPHFIRKACSTNDEYGIGSTCTKGRCRPFRLVAGYPCLDDDDCAKPLRCGSRRVCRSGARVNEKCEISSDCKQGLSCIAEKCKEEKGVVGSLCSANEQCKTGVCIKSRCRKQSDKGGPCGDDSHCSAGLTCSRDGEKKCQSMRDSNSSPSEAPEGGSGGDSKGGSDGSSNGGSNVGSNSTNRLAPIEIVGIVIGIIVSIIGLPSTLYVYKLYFSRKRKGVSNHQELEDPELPSMVVAEGM